MANQNFRVKKGIEVGLGATFLYADDSGVGINSASPRSNLDVRGRSQTEELLVDNYAEVQGPSTFVGLGTFGGDLYVGNDLYVKGNLSFTSFESETGNVTGVLTTRDFNVTGLSTFAGDATFQSDVNISGASSITGNLVVSGASTLTGIVTTGDDLYVGGSLYVFNDIFYDEITGRNLSISGIATLRQLEIQQDLEVAGLSTFVGLVSFRDAVGTNLTVYNLSANTGNFVEINVDGGGGGGGGTGIDSTSVNTEFLNVTGVATFNNGIATNFSAEFIDAGVTTTTDLHFTNGYGVNLNMSGITTVGILTVYENIYDSRNQVGYGDSLLVTQGGKLVWTRPDIAGIATSFQPGSTFYVSENGSNTNDGRSPEKAWSSIAYAVSQIGDTSHDILEVTAGEYTETFPITVPKGLTISGAGQRATIVRPSQATETNDGFLLNDRSTIHNITVTGFYKPQGSINYAFKFSVGAAITSRSPYVDKVTVINKGTQTSASDPYGYGSADSYPTTAPGGAGVLVDGSVVATNSLEAAILLNEVTLFTAGNQGIKITNGGRVEWLNGFIYFASEALVGLSDKTTGLAGAGKARLTLENASGGLVGGNTVQYYDSDGTTVLASGTIDNVSGSYVTLTNAGVGTFTTPRNRTAKKVDFVNGAQLSTAQARFGTSSLDVTGAGTDNITVDSTSDFGFGTGDFTVEFWIYRTGNINGKVICDFRDTAATDQAITIQGDGGNETDVYIGTTSVVTGTVPTTLNAWNHIAVCRVGSTITQYIDGAVSGSGTAATDLGVARQLTFGDRYDNSNNGPTAYLDELRVTKGAAKYTGAFTSPSVALTGDKDTSILLHFDGINGATSTTDDIIVLQDIRITGGNTADKVTLADYSQFGADLRSIACAIEYGNQGMIGDGDGVTLRAISINFNHVGALGDITNDPNLAIQSNEVIELNGGQVSYVSIDQKGDFRVGESFYVNQETGDVSFNNTTTDLTSLSSLTITDGTNNSLITPTSGRFGNVQISGQQVASVSGDLDLVTAGGGEVNIYGNTNVVGILTAQVVEINAIQKGDTSIALDDTGTDGTIRFNTDGSEAGRFTKDNDLAVTHNFRVGGIGTIPNLVSTTATITTLNVENLVSSGSTSGGGGTGIGSTAINSPNLNISGQANFNNVNVSGVATVPDLTVTNSFTNTGYSTITGDAEVGGNLWLKGDLNVIGSQNVSEFFATNMEISGIATFGTVKVNSNVHCDDTVFVGGAVTITGPITAVDIFATGIGTIPVADVGHADVDSINVTGISTISQVDIGKITVGDFTVTGFATVTDGLEVIGPVSFGGSITQLPLPTGQGGVWFDNSVVGVGTLLATNASISGLLGVGNSLGVAGDAYIDGNIIGSGGTISNYNEIITPLLTATDIDAATLDVSGNVTIDGNVDLGDTSADFVRINGRVSTSFIPSTDSATDLGSNGLRWKELFVDKLTLTDDAAIGGDLSVGGSVSADYVDTTELNVSGVATFAQISIGGGGGGISTNGVIINNVTVTDQSTLNNLIVSGVSTFVGVSTFKGDVYIDGNLIIDGDNSQDLISGTNLLVSGIATIGTLGVTTNLTVGGDVLVSGAMTAGSYNGDGSQLDNLPAASITTSITPTTRVNGDTLQTGDLWYDSSELRQYTYYDDGGSVQWVPSAPEPTIPDFTYAGNTGIGTLSLGDDTFSVVGDGTNVVTTASGVTTTVTISLSDSVAIAGSMTAGSFLGENLNVSGVSTFVGVTTFRGDVFIEGNLIIDGDESQDLVSGTNLIITGIATIGTLGVTTTTTNTLTVLDTFTLDNPVNSIGISSDLGGAGAAHTALASQLAIKQYIDANNSDQNLNFTGDTGSGSIGLGTEFLEVRGTAQQVTTIGVGNSVVIGLPNTVRVPQRLYVGGGAFTQVMDANSASGVVFANKIVTINKGLTLSSSDLTGVRNLVQTGIATLGTVNFSGVTTTVGNAFVGNDLSVLGTVNANDFNSTSDATRKEDVVEIEDALAKVLDLRGVTFNWKNGEGSSAGVLAQEVQMVLPEIVKGDVGNMSVQYNGIIALLVQAVKELSSEVEELKRTKSDKRRKKS
ncbi:baseplate wedge initiator [Synechococcus phage ACG-2014f]|uniref:Baseplate wedge initiator n=1 Tax=Synechococcus phage ACG-2014f TaxID=1493511 RepID=A0A0E3FM34_9CAUD|nr:baseplate wedge initiator [Synechococcus phage ACG-2014f]